MENASVKIPNFFYDLIVFITPSLSLLIGVLTGFGPFGFTLIKTNLVLLKLSGIDIIVLLIIVFILLLFLAYEYGRLAEAISDFISNYVKLLRRKKILFTKEKDFSINFKNEIAKLNINELLDDDRMDKWTIYFYALRFQPELGGDLLKRYAWEKLARSSSLTYGILFLISLLIGLLRLFGIKSILYYQLLDTGVFGFGSLFYSFSSFILFYLTCYEYYRRRSWNNDLLIKTIPILILPDNFNSLKPEIPKNQNIKKAKSKKQS